MLLCEQEPPYTFNAVAKRTRDQPPPQRHTRREVNHHNGLARPTTSCSSRPSSQGGLLSGSSGSLGNLSGTSQSNNPTLPPASAQDLASPPPHADSFRSISISAPPATVEDPRDGQNAVIEGTNPRRGPTTGGIEIWIYSTNLPNGSTPLYARFGETVTRAISTSELLWITGFNLVPSRTRFSLAYYPISCRLKTVRAWFRSPFREDPLPTLLLLEEFSANLSITSTSTNRKPGPFLLFAYLPPTQSHNSRPHSQKLQSRASGCLGTSCQKSELPHSVCAKNPKGPELDNRNLQILKLLLADRTRAEIEGVHADGSTVILVAAPVSVSVASNRSAEHDPQIQTSIPLCPSNNEVLTLLFPNAQGRGSV